MGSEDAPDFVQKIQENGQLNPEGYSCANSHRLPEEAGPQANVEAKTESPSARSNPNGTAGEIKAECLDLTTNLNAFIKCESTANPSPVGNPKVFVKQEAEVKAAALTRWKRCCSPENVVVPDFYRNLVIKEEVVEEANDDAMMHLENGCTNSDCNLQKQCLRQYRCHKCNLIFTESETFAAHLRTCSILLPVIQSTVSLATQDFNEPELRNLVENVKKHPCLYDTRNKDYNNSQLRDSVWANVASECNFPSGSAAKVAWQKLKDSFQDFLHAHNRAAKPTRPWRYQKQMEFLLPHLTYRHASNKRLINDRGDQGAPSSDNSRQNDVSVVSPAKKQKTPPSTLTNEAVNMSQKNKESQTKAWRGAREPTVRPSTSSQPLDMFFMSMCETTKNLPPQLQIAVKRKVFKAVIEAEEAASSMRGNEGARNENNLSAHSLPPEADESSESGQDD